MCIYTSLSLERKASLSFKKHRGVYNFLILFAYFCNTERSSFCSRLDYAFQERSKATQILALVHFFQKNKKSRRQKFPKNTTKNSSIERGLSSSSSSVKREREKKKSFLFSSSRAHHHQIRWKRFHFFESSSRRTRRTSPGKRCTPGTSRKAPGWKSLKRSWNVIWKTRTRWR